MDKSLKRLHFIAIGGSIMHNLAINLKQQGFEISGSDDQFFEPSKGNLTQHDLLPSSEGWDAAKITTELDGIILGMHAKADNPELLKAQELNLPIYSFPEYIYEHSKDKQRIIIAGSHGKTSITSMVLHVLKHYNRTFDYAVGAQIKGFDTMVKLSSDAPYIIIEGDEYLTSPLKPTPKFFEYHHHIALISGIAWDHANVFPTFENYVEQFEKLSKATPKAGTLIYNKEDKAVKKIVESNEDDILKFDYKTPKYKIEDGTVIIKHNKIPYNLQIFGKHNLNNLEGARTICSRLCVSDEDFYEAMQSFEGAGKRLEVISKDEKTAIYRDFAHSPSKLKATVEAVKELYPKRKLTACFELHTFSSLKPDFMKEYKDCIKSADQAVIYFNPEVVAKKGLGEVNEALIKEAFNQKNLTVVTDSNKIIELIKNENWDNHNLLMMSSGNFDNIDFYTLPELI